MLKPAWGFVLLLSFFSCAMDPGPQGRYPPKGTPLRDVQVSMGPADVREVLGEPGQVRDYIAWSAMDLFNISSRDALIVWVYPGQGRVVFSKHAFSSDMRVERIEYDPSETVK